MPNMNAAAIASIPKSKRPPADRPPADRAPPAKRRRSISPQDRPRRSPSRSSSRSPPRKRKRPGAGARISAADTEAVRRRQLEREKEQAAAVERGVSEVVRQHYNAVPERGREWRKEESKIKGLRSFNNWVKSALIQKFSPNEDYTPGAQARHIHGTKDNSRPLRVLDIGCGKGGDLQKWQNAPQAVGLYVAADPADVSIQQARSRYQGMPRVARGGEFRGRPLFHGEFAVKDCFGEWIGDIPIVREVGIDSRFGPGTGGGFDVVSMMFCMHYAFENEERARGMLRNVAGSLRKGGRFLGVIPNSEVLSVKMKDQSHGITRKPSEAVNGSADDGGLNYDDESAPEQPKDDDREEGEDSDEGWDPEKPAEPSSQANGHASDDDSDWDPENPSEQPAVTSGRQENTSDDPAKHTPSSHASPAQAADSHPNKTPVSPAPPLTWGNSLYRINFPHPPHNAVFRPIFGWKYFFYLAEAVEEVPEYVVPWEAFRALASDYNLELRYKKTFREVWNEEKDDAVLGELSERMGVRERGMGRAGRLMVSPDEMEAASFYCAFCFYKV